MQSKQCKWCHCWNCRWCGADNCYHDTQKPCWDCNGHRHERKWVQDKIDLCPGWEKAPAIIMDMRR